MYLSIVTPLPPPNLGGKAGDFPLMDPRPWYVGHYVGMLQPACRLGLPCRAEPDLFTVKSILSGSGNFLFAFKSSIFCSFHF